jgi:TRAP-type mannitol/chloroaromatic compound transport system substrate-binding protein
MKKGFWSLFVILTIGLAFAVVDSPSVFAQGKTFKWRMQSVDDAGLMEYKMIPVAFADRVRQLSNGRLDIKVFPPGGLVPSFEVWEAMRKGVFEMTQHYLVYWSGKEPGFKAAQEWPACNDPLQGLIWIYHGGGMEISNKMTEKYGIRYIGATPMEREHIWSKKPIKGVADLKGLKMRAAGVAADSFALLGASVVTVPGGEIYQALERGVIDACEFTFPTVNYSYGFHEVTKYITMPTYSGGGWYDWLVNAKAWQELPDDLKLIVDVAIKETTLLYWAKVRVETEVVLDKLKKHGMNFITWAPEDMAKLEKARYQTMQKYAEGSPLYAEKFKSMMDLAGKIGYKP